MAIVAVGSVSGCTSGGAPGGLSGSMPASMPDASAAPGSTPALAAGDKRDVPTRLTWESYAEVKRHVVMRPKDFTYQSIPWRSTVLEGLRDAQVADKPMLLWLYFGGPRGAC